MLKPKRTNASNKTLSNLFIIILVLIFIGTFNRNELSSQTSSNSQQSTTGSSASKDLNAKINQIKVWYKEIKDSEKKYTRNNKASINDEGGEVSVTIYKDGNEIKEICSGIAGPGDCGEVITIFYHNSLPFFVLYESECFVDNKTTKDVNRYYLDNGKLIQYLEGTAKKNIKPGTKEFIDAENTLQDYIEQIPSID
jgi:hypothetical protein